MCDKFALLAYLPLTYLHTYRLLSSYVSVFLTYLVTYLLSFSLNRIRRFLFTVYFLTYLQYVTYFKVSC